MASDPQYDEQFQPEPPRKQGMSTGVKVLLILLCIGGVFALLCCGGVVYFAYSFRNAMSEDPVVVKEVTKTIADIDIPPNFEPAVSMDINVFTVKMRFVVYQTKNKSGTLMLMEMAVANASEEDMRQSMNERGQGQNMKKLQINKTETKTFKVRGKDVPFTFAEAVDKKTKTEYEQVSGKFPGKDNGVVMLVLQVPKKDYNEDQVIKMIKSIK